MVVTTAQATNQQLIEFFNPGTTSSSSLAYNIPFKKGLLIAQGTWNGATVTFFQNSPDGTFVPVSDMTGTVISWTSDSAIGIDYIVMNQQMYASIASAGGSTSLVVTIQRVE